MAGKYGKKARKLPIEELALQHLTVHPNDKSGGIRSKMHRTFGRKATWHAIERAADVLQMCDPNFVRPKQDPLPSWLE